MRIGSVQFTGLDFTQASSVATAAHGGVEHVFDLADSNGNQVALDNGIARIEFNDNEGEFIDGFRVTYKYTDPKTNQSKEGSSPVVHGTFNEAEVHHKDLVLKENEYICGARVLYVGKDTDEQYIARITLWANRPGSSHAYQAGDWGEKPTGDYETSDWHWEKKDGKLYTFGARQDNSEDSRGLKTLAFGELHTQANVAQSEMYPAVDASSKDTSKDFDDLKKYGPALNLDHPIKLIEVWSDRIVEGIQVTYNLNNGRTLPVLHGSKVSNIAPTRIELNENEDVVEIIGIHGEACPDTQLGDRINLLEFRVFNKKAGMFRNSGTCGRIQENFVQKTRKDICIRGPLIALAGRAEKTKRYGLHNLQGFTRVPASNAPGNQPKSGAAATATTTGNTTNGAGGNAAPSAGTPTNPPTSSASGAHCHC